MVLGRYTAEIQNFCRALSGEISFITRMYFFRLFDIEVRKKKDFVTINLLKQLWWYSVEQTISPP